MNGMNKKTMAKVAIALVAVASLGLAAFTTPIVVPWYSQVTLTPTASGSTKVAIGGYLDVTVGEINPTIGVTMMLYEQTPDGVWHTFDLSGSYESGSVRLAFGGNSGGTHMVRVWVDNTLDGKVDASELAELQIRVVGSNGCKGTCAYLGFAENSWTQLPPVSAGDRQARKG
jgi:hypothetical protein